jgi:hypothetical protein
MVGGESKNPANAIAAKPFIPNIFHAGARSSRKRVVICLMSAAIPAQSLLNNAIEYNQSNRRNIFNLGSGEFWSFNFIFVTARGVIDFVGFRADDGAHTEI